LYILEVDHGGVLSSNFVPSWPNNMIRISAPADPFFEPAGAVACGWPGSGNFPGDADGLAFARQAVEVRKRKMTEKIKAGMHGKVEAQARKTKLRVRYGVDHVNGRDIPGPVTELRKAGPRIGIQPKMLPFNTALLRMKGDHGLTEELHAAGRTNGTFFCK
jgi:hypothetical protein